MIYNPQAHDNEEKSNDYAQNFLRKLNLAQSLTELVATLIMDTKHHQPSTETGAIIVDADLAILGSTPDVYSVYAAAIRQEYSWVLEEAYRHGRAQVLQKFLERATIYNLTEAQNRWETAARRNLQQEIKALTHND